MTDSPEGRGIDELSEFILARLSGQKRDLYEALWNSYSAGGSGLDRGGVAASIGWWKKDDDDNPIRTAVSKLRSKLKEIQDKAPGRFTHRVAIPLSAPYHLEFCGSPPSAIKTAEAEPFDSPQFAVRRRAAMTGIILGIVVVAFAGWRWASTFGQPMLDVNLRMEQKLDGAARGWRNPEANRSSGVIRLPRDTELRWLVKANRAGYLYAAAEERYSDGTAGPPQLLVGNSANRLEPGSFLAVPQDHFMRYMPDQPGAGKEVVADYWYVLISPEQIPVFAGDRVDTRLTEKEFAIFAEAYRATLDRTIVDGDPRTLLDGRFSGKVDPRRPIAFHVQLVVAAETTPRAGGSPRGLH